MFGFKWEKETIYVLGCVWFGGFGGERKEYFKFNVFGSIFKRVYEGRGGKQNSS
jgi:hypothetical protein